MNKAMNAGEIVSCTLVDEAALTPDELAHACGVSLEWVSLRMESGLLRALQDAPADALGNGPERRADWRFTGHDLWRARQLYALERDFDALPELAALVVDLREEINRLRTRLHCMR